jgi:hypothetical protein
MTSHLDAERCYHSPPAYCISDKCVYVSASTIELYIMQLFDKNKNAEICIGIHCVVQAYLFYLSRTTVSILD